LTPDGILPGSDKLKAVRDFKATSTMQEISLKASAILFVHMLEILQQSVNKLTSKEAKSKWRKLLTNC
jgi:hypothetical protein